MAAWRQAGGHDGGGGNNGGNEKWRRRRDININNVMAANGGAAAKNSVIISRKSKASRHRASPLLRAACAGDAAARVSSAPHLISDVHQTSRFAPARYAAHHRAFHWRGIYRCGGIIGARRGASSKRVRASRLLAMAHQRSDKSRSVSSRRCLALRMRAA
jgi:hypothetical protein